MKREKTAKRTTILIAAVAVLGIAALLFLAGKGEERDAGSSSTAGNTETEFTPVSEQTEREKGVLRLLIWEGHAPPDHVRSFENLIKEKYDFKIKLDIRYVQSPDEFYTSIRDGSVDVVAMTHHLFKDERFKFIEKKLLLPLNLENIPNYKHVIPALQKAEFLRSKDRVYASPESQGPYGLAYNTLLLKKAPKSWNILWEPRFKGKYVIGANEYIYNANITALAMGYPRESLSSYDALDNPEFKTKLRELAVNAHSFWIGVDKADDLSGHALATSWGDALGPLNKRGEPWKMAEPTEGMPCWIDNLAITSALADRPFLKTLAEEYINYSLRTDYQVGLILRGVGTIPVVTNIEDLLSPEEKKRTHIGTPNFFDNNRILVTTYSERDRNGIKLLWKEAMSGIQIGGEDK